MSTHPQSHYTVNGGMLMQFEALFHGWFSAVQRGDIELDRDILNEWYIVCCARGDIDNVRLLSRYFWLDMVKIPKTLVESGFMYACNNGHAEMADWLCKQHQIHQGMAKERLELLCKDLCRGGMCETLQWLHYSGKINVLENERLLENMLYCALMRYHFSVAQWLIDMEPSLQNNFIAVYHGIVPQPMLNK